MTVITEPSQGLHKENQFTETGSSRLFVPISLIAEHASTAMPIPERSLSGFSELVYGIYAVLVFLVFGLLAFLLVMLPLGIRARREIAHWTARAFFAVAGMRIRLHDPENLPAGPCVVVANHASYIDGVVLKALLPARFCFVIKKEVSRVPLAGLLLRRIGSEFVDRFNRHAGGMDARRLIKAADAGQALAFFPEGTFLAEPGLGKFHTGAFAIAARAGCRSSRSPFAAPARSSRAGGSCLVLAGSTSRSCRRSGRCRASSRRPRSPRPAIRLAPVSSPLSASRICRKMTVLRTCRRGAHDTGCIACPRPHHVHASLS